MAARQPSTTLLQLLALLALLGVLVIGLSGCVAPVDTRGAQAQLAGRCKLVAYNIDQQNSTIFHRGLISWAVTQDNENRRRQEIYDACLEAQ